MSDDSQSCQGKHTDAATLERERKAQVEKNRNPSFCALAWLHFYTEPDGAAKHCCISSTEAGDNKGSIYGMQSHPLKDIWNSEVFRETRRKMLDGELVHGCQNCYAREKEGEISYRHWANDYWLGRPETRDLVEGLLSGEYGVEDPTIAPNPVSFDIRVGTLCNLKCRMCNSRYSSQIEADPVHRAWTSNWMPRRLPSRFPDAADWSESQHLLDELVEFSKDVLYIQLAGGEPTLNRTQSELIKKILASGRASQIDVLLWTNTTNVRPEFFDLLKPFRRVSVNMSLDGIDSVLEYIRYPAKWSALSKNIEKLKAYGFALAVHPVAQIYNAYHLPRLLEWADDNGIAFGLNTVNGSDFLKIGILSDKAIKRFEEGLNGYLERRKEKFGADAHADSQISQLIGFVREEHMKVKRSTLMAHFIAFTNDLDAQRKQSFAKACPEAYAAIVEEIGVWPTAHRFVTEDGLLSEEAERGAA